jgi:hypothetical protein
VLDELGIWHCLAYGTLLGAVREGRVIAWDHDLDLFVRPADLPRLLLASGTGGLRFSRTRAQGGQLAANPGGVPWFFPGAVLVSDEAAAYGELWAPTLFSDGVLRLYDLDREAYYWPHCSFPHWSLQELATVELDGRPYPAPREPETWLAWHYGSDWRTPVRAPSDGGPPVTDRGWSGEPVAPGLAERVRFCVQEKGWDRSLYADEPPWPRRIDGAGPRGWGAGRAAGTSGSYGWHTLDELAREY